MTAAAVAPTAPAKELDTLRRRYLSILRRREAIALCRDLGIGESTFRDWCRTNPVPGLQFRLKITGLKEWRYRRETILTACCLTD